MTLGILNLGDEDITAAVTDEVITEGSSAQSSPQLFVDRLDGMQAVTLSARFTYGSGGTTCAAIVQTSLDQGATWIDIARFDFTTASARKVANLSGLLSKAVTAIAALSVEGVSDGVLGDRLRAIVTSTGTYAGGTSISVRAHAR